MPLVTVVIVIVNPIINSSFDIRKVLAERKVNFIFHVAEETLLRSIVPTITFPRHGLAEVGILDEPDKLAACVMAPLIAMDQRLRAEGYAMVLNKRMDGFKHKIHRKRVTEYMRQDLPGKGIQNDGKIIK